MFFIIFIAVALILLLYVIGFKITPTGIVLCTLIFMFFHYANTKGANTKGDAGKETKKHPQNIHIEQSANTSSRKKIPKSVFLRNKKVSNETISVEVINYSKTELRDYAISLRYYDCPERNSPLDDCSLLKESTHPQKLPLPPLKTTTITEPTSPPPQANDILRAEISLE